MSKWIFDKQYAILLLTPAAIVALEIGRLFGYVPQYPFLSVFLSVALTLGFFGFLRGAISMAIAFAFVAYRTMLGLGPEVLEDISAQGKVAVAITVLIVIAMGARSDRNARIIRELEASKGGLIEDQAMLKTEVDRQTKKLRELSKKLLRIQEEERASISRELHDSVAQSLTVLKLQLSVLNPDTETQAARINEAMNVIDSTMAEVRTLALGLRPAILDQIGLAAAIRWYVRQQTEHTNLQVDVDIDPDLPSNIPTSAATLCFRCVQESVTNVIKHADASSLAIRLRYFGDELLLTVDDDGRGFDVNDNVEINEHGGLGLSGMIERFDLANGRLSIESGPDQGTRISASISATKPIDYQPQAQANAH